MKNLHTIKVAAKRSGLSTHLIRMWERRYQAVKPERSDTGRRLYSDEEIDRLRKLKQATEAGESIGQIADLSNSELAELLENQEVDDSNGNRDLAVLDTSSAEFHYRICLDCVYKMDTVALETCLLKAYVTLGPEYSREKVQDCWRSVPRLW